MAVNHLIAIDEVLGSFGGDDGVQFVELRMLAPGQRSLAEAGGTELVFDDATASPGGRRVFRFGFPDPNTAVEGSRVLVATARLAAVAGVQPDYVLPEGFLAPRAGRVCYVVNPPRPECLAEWRVTNASGRPGGDGRARVRQRCKDGDPGCDADDVVGTCTFTLAVCLGRDDARLARGSRRCRRPSIAAWALLRPPLAGPEAAIATALVDAVAALGTPTVAGGTAAWAPALDATERCTAPIAVVVPAARGAAGTRVLRTRTVGARPKLRDVDTLRLVCNP
ncbi:MAG TPA: hypothetical protein VFD84_04925 [Candidatus Binatia bacterium]|nr:hypothetical protein [Candidatus Binatia bacterium]